MQQFHDAEQKATTLAAQLVQMQRKNRDLNSQIDYARQVLDMIDICMTYITHPSAAQIPIDLLNELPEEVAKNIAQNQQCNRDTNSCTISEINLQFQRNIRDDLLDISSEILYIDATISKLKQQLQANINDFQPMQIMDLPTEIFAHLVKFLPFSYRRVCKAFRKFVPIVRAKIDITTQIISQVDPNYLCGTGLLDITLKIVTNQSLLAAAQIAQNRELTLHLVNVHTHARPSDQQIAPTHLDLYNCSILWFVNTDRLRTLRVGDYRDIEAIAARLTDKTPLEHIPTPTCVRRSMYATAPILIRSAGPITMSALTLRILLRNNVHFLHPPRMVNVTSRQFRRLRRYATTSVYAQDDITLTSRPKFTVKLQQKSVTPMFYDVSWLTIVAL